MWEVADRRRASGRWCGRRRIETATRPLSGGGQRDRERCRLQVEYTGGIDGVAIHPHDVLAVDRRHRPIVGELAEGATPYGPAEIEIGFGADEVAAWTALGSTVGLDAV
jgi:hypothetical protein